MASFLGSKVTAKAKEKPYLGFGDIEAQIKKIAEIAQYEKRANQKFFTQANAESSSIIFTVPAGKIFFMDSAFITGTTTSLQPEEIIFIFNPTTGTAEERFIGCISSTGGISQTYPMPIRITAGNRLVVEGDSIASNGVRYCLTGWLEDEKVGSN